MEISRTLHWQLGRKRLRQAGISRLQDIYMWVTVVCRARTISQSRSLWPTLHLLRGYVRALLHQGSDSEPQRIDHCKLIHIKLRVSIARMRIIPFVGREPFRGWVGDEQTQSTIVSCELDPSFLN